jgi:hypothetical protein
VKEHNNCTKRGLNIMHLEILIALIIAIPVIVFPAAYLWYMDIGGIYTSYKEAKAKRLARKTR